MKSVIQWVKDYDDLIVISIISALIAFGMSIMTDMMSEQIFVFVAGFVACFITISVYYLICKI